MAYNANISNAAWQDIEEAIEWYDLQSKDLGDRFLDEVYNTIDLIETHPSAFSLIESGYRQTVMNVFPFVITYKILVAEINIIAVFHTSRNPENKIR